MKWSTFAIASALLLALFVFAQRRTAEVPRPALAGVVDLTHSISGVDANGRDARLAVASQENFSTHIDAPAHFVRGAWTVDEIPVDRLVAPLVVVDVRKGAQNNPDYQVGMDDLATWEQANGPLPAGAVVVARTGWATRWYNGNDYRNADSQGVMHFPGFSVDAVKFLVDARQIAAVGIDTLSVDAGRSRDLAVHQFTGARQIYHVENVANLDKVPEAGATAVIAPAKLQGGSAGPVRILALLR